MKNEIEKPFENEIIKLNKKLEDGVKIKSADNKIQFHLFSESINIDYRKFTIKFILTNISKDPFSIYNMKLKIDGEDLACFSPDIKYAFKPLTYLRKNEAISFINEYHISFQLTKIDNFKINLELCGIDKEVAKIF